MKYKVLSIKYLLGIFLFVILTTYFLILTTSPAHAESPHILRVFPIIIHVPLSPDKTYKHEVTVENLTNNALPIRASLSDFLTTGEEGGYIFEETHNNPLLSWIRLSDTDLILNPHQKKKVSLTIKTPKSIPLGGYYGMLFFEMVPQDTSLPSTRIIPKVGVLMLANVGVPDPKAKKAEIVTYSTGLFHQDNAIPLLLRVKNVSLHYFTAKPILTIYPLLPQLSQNPKNPQLAQPQYLEEKIVFQGKIRRWEQQLTLADAQPNIYKATMKVSTGGGEYVEESRYFIILPLIPLFLLLLLILLIVFHKRILNAIKAFYQG